MTVPHRGEGSVPGAARLPANSSLFRSPEFLTLLLLEVNITCCLIFPMFSCFVLCISKDS